MDVFRNFLRNRRPSFDFEEDRQRYFDAVSNDDDDEDDFDYQTPWSVRYLTTSQGAGELDFENNDQNLYVGNLPHECTSESLAQFLSSLCDGVEATGTFEVNLIKLRGSRSRPHFAFVKCPSSTLAQFLIRKAQTEDLLFFGNRLRVEKRRSPSTSGERIERLRLQFLALSEDEPEGAVGLTAEDLSSDSDQSPDYEDFFDFGPTPNPFANLRSSIELAGTTRFSIYSQKRKEFEKEMKVLEKELNAKLERANSRVRTISTAKKLKDSRRNELLKNLSETQSKLAKVESEIAALDADKNQTEDDFRQFVDEHEAKVKTIQDNIRKLRIERDNSQPSENDVNANDLEATLTERVRDELDCICCYDRMTFPIFQCSSGHLICNECQGKLHACPVCREVYRLPGIRCRLAENLLETLSKKVEGATQSTNS